MKNIIFYVTLGSLVAIFSVSAMPTHEQHNTLVGLSTDSFPNEEYYHIEERSDRQARATCDLLSISLPWGSLNHSACAAHCLAKNKGFRGGRCKDGVCHCRK